MSSEFKICPDCLSENDINAKFCNSCGFDFQKQSKTEFDINVFYNIDDTIDDAILAFKGEDYHLSLELIDSYLDEIPEDEYGWAFKSHVLSKLNYMNDAVSCCDIALNIDDMCEIAWVSKAYHYYIMEKYEEALSCCQSALILNSEDEFINKLIESISNSNLEDS